MTRGDMFQPPCLLQRNSPQFCRGIALVYNVEVAHHPVIINYLEMRCRESNCHEIVVFLVTSVFRVVLRFLVADKSCGSRAMMTVCNIERRNFVELSCDFLYNIFILYHPKCMSESVRCGKIILKSPEVTSRIICSRRSLSGNAKNTGSILALLQRTCFIRSSSLSRRVSSCFLIRPSI